MDKKEMLIDTYDSIVDEYVDNEFDNPSMLRHYEKFLSLIPKKSLILDIGCGPGQASKYFADKEHEITGIDLSKNMIDFAKKNVSNAKFSVSDVENLDINQKFDAIWAAFILIHIPREKHKEIIKKFHSMLNKKGVLFLGMIEGEGEEIIPDPYNEVPTGVELRGIKP